MDGIGMFVYPSRCLLDITNRPTDSQPAPRSSHGLQGKANLQPKCRFASQSSQVAGNTTLQNIPLLEKALPSKTTPGGQAEIKTMGCLMNACLTVTDLMHPT